MQNKTCDSPRYFSLRERSGLRQVPTAWARHSDRATTRAPHTIQSSHTDRISSATEGMTPCSSSPSQNRVFSLMFLYINAAIKFHAFPGFINRECRGCLTAKTQGKKRLPADLSKGSNGYKSFRWVGVAVSEKQRVPFPSGMDRRTSQAGYLYAVRRACILFRGV